MLKIKQCLTVAALVTVAWPVFAQAPSDLGKRLADGYVRPAMAGFAQQAGELEKALSTWCQHGVQADVKPVKDAFTRTMQAWAGVEFLRFGPLVQSNRYEKLAFWPDTRGVMQRQVRALLSAADPAVIAPGALASRSVAVQGLPALEYVLYDTSGLLGAPSAAAEPYACRYAVAIAANVVTISTELQQAWSPEGEFGQQFTAPAPNNALYRSQQEVAAEAVKALSTGLQFAREVKLLPVLGESVQSARAQRAAWWRSSLTVPTLVASIQGMRAFYEAGQYRYPDGEAWIGPALTGEMDRAVQTLEKVNLPLRQALADEAVWQRLALVGLILNNAKSLVDEHVAPALGVTIGFNALDGD